MKKRKAIYHHNSPKSYNGKKWAYTHDDWEVLVKGIVEKWAVVNRPGYLPFLVKVSDLTFEVTHERNNP
jgi:hypothetical protein